MSTQDTEAAGRIYRHKKADRHALDYIDAEIGAAANDFRIAACQLENLLADDRSDVGPALAKINMPGLLKNLADREVLRRKLADCDRALRKLGEQQ
ncbi:MAG TPA: hypothetical protein VHZ07_24835 [Bryobacteraceae bacterium]|jgi:hypothetical protein|nr:hypothetical protein [Bryobacteraceae bacterium]